MFLTAFLSLGIGLRRLGCVCGRRSGTGSCASIRQTTTLVVRGLDRAFLGLFTLSPPHPNISAAHPAFPFGFKCTLSRLFRLYSEATWFKVPLEITRSGLGADQLRGVIKHHKGTITVEFDLSRPLFLD